VVNWIKTSQISDEQDKVYNESNLIVAKDKIETTIADVRNQFLQIARDKKLESFRVEQQLVGGDDPKQAILQSYGAYEAIHGLMQYKNTVKGLQLIGLFYKLGDFVIDNLSAYPAEDYFKHILQVTGFGVSNWYGLASSYQNFNVLPNDSGFLYDKPITGTIFYQTIPLNDSSVQGMIFAVAGSAMFKNVLDALSADGQSYGLIVDENNRVVASSDNYNIEVPVPSYASLVEQAESGQLESGVYQYYAGKINAIPWKVVMIRTPPATSANGIWFSRTYILLFASILLASMAIAYLLTHYSYRPLQRLYRSMNPAPLSEVRFPNRLIGTAFQEIESRIAQMKERQTVLHKQINNYSGSLKTGMLYCLIKKGDIARFEEVLDDFSHRWTGGQAVFTLILRTSTYADDKRAAQVMAKVHRFISSQLFIYCAVHDFLGQLVLLVWLPQGLANQERYFRDQIKQISAYMNELADKYMTDIYAGMSGLCHSVDELVLSSDHARISLRDNTLFSHVRYVCDAAAETLSQPLPLPLRMKLQHHLKAREYEAIAELMAPYLEQPGETGDPQAPYAANGQMLYQALLAIALEYVDNDHSGEAVVDKTRLVQAESIRDMLRFYKELCSDASDQAKQDTKKEIIAFIDKHFANPDISLQMVKEQFHISFALITRMVKQETGFNFLEYVSRLRVEYAKTLLKRDEGSIAWVRERSGFNDDSTFIKVFKKYGGMTPGDYRKHAIQMAGQVRK